MTLKDVKKSLIPPLSYSSMNEIIGCEHKYALRKVLEAEPDSDYSKETDAMDLGTVVHACLEACKHDLTGFKYVDVVEQIKEFPETLEPSKHGPLVWSMLRHYKDLHEDAGLQAAEVELELTLPKEFKGFVDLVLDDQEGGGVWITDLKTAASISRFLKSRLPNDPQLNLYAYYFQKMFPERKVLGCRYRVITKSRLKQRKDETTREFSNRIYAGINAYEYVIPIEKMDPDTHYKRFKKVKARQNQLHKNVVAAKNYLHCESYFRPCEYWSRCHGKNFTDDFGIQEKVF